MHYFTGLPYESVHVNVEYEGRKYEFTTNANGSVQDFKTIIRTKVDIDEVHQVLIFNQSRKAKAPEALRNYLPAESVHLYGCTLGEGQEEIHVSLKKNPSSFQMLKTVFFRGWPTTFMYVRKPNSKPFW